MKKKRPSKRGREAKPARSSSTSSKEAWVLAACIIGFIVFLGIKSSMVGIAQQRAAFDKQLAKWRQTYRLTDEQAARIQQLEADFHGNGNPFTSRGAGKSEEDEAHLLELSRAMNLEDGERFLRDMKLGKHQGTQ